MTSGATLWLDAVKPLTRYGPVIAPDLPGALFGHSPLHARSDVHAGPAARFLGAVSSTLGLGRIVVHGWSFGGLVALVFADAEPGRVERLVLISPTLPGPLTRAEAWGWRTVGRAALLGGPTVARGVMRVLGPSIVRVKLRYARAGTGPAGRLDVAGGDLSRCSPELWSLIRGQLGELRSHPRRMDHAVTAFASVVRVLFVDRRPAEELVARVAAPTLLLWGDRDPLIGRAVIDDLTGRRPDWRLQMFATVGHLLPLEVPAEYADAVGRWLAGHDGAPDAGAGASPREP
ncbi:MAG: alpha/beta fold hydrolase [Actinomycetota bacterium]